MRVGVAQLVCESGKIVCRIHGSELPHDNRLERVMVYHATIDRWYVGINYPYKQSCLKDNFCTLENMVNAGMDVGDSCKLVPEDGKASTLKSKSHDHINAFHSDSKISPVFIPCDVHPTIWQTMSQKVALRAPQKRRRGGSDESRYRC